MKPKPVKRKTEVTRPDLVSRYEALGVPSREFERLASIPYKFVDAARAGKLRSAKSAASWKKFEAALVALEATRSREAKAPPPKAAAEASGPGALLINAIKAAQEPDTCAKLVDEIGEAMVRGDIDPSLGRVLKELVAEKRQCFKAAAEEEEKARAGEPLVIQVVYVNRFAAPTLAPK